MPDPDSLSPIIDRLFKQSTMTRFSIHKCLGENIVVQSKSGEIASLKWPSCRPSANRLNATRLFSVLVVIELHSSSVVLVDDDFLVSTTPAVFDDSDRRWSTSR